MCSRSASCSTSCSRCAVLSTARIRGRRRTRCCRSSQRLSIASIPAFRETSRSSARRPSRSDAKTDIRRRASSATTCGASCVTRRSSRDRIDAFIASARRDADHYFEMSAGTGELLAAMAWRRDHALELVKDAVYVDDSKADLVAVAERLRKNGGFVVEAHDRSGALVSAQLVIAEIDLPSGLPRDFESSNT